MIHQTYYVVYTDSDSSDWNFPTVQEDPILGQRYQTQHAHVLHEIMWYQTRGGGEAVSANRLVAAAADTSEPPSTKRIDSCDGMETRAL